MRAPGYDWTNEEIKDLYGYMYSFYDAILENRTNAVCDTCKSLIEQIAMEKFIQEVFYEE